MMQSRLIYASTLDGTHAALFINGAVVLTQSHADQKDCVSRTAERIARALQVTLYSCVVTPPADWSGNWQELHDDVDKRAPASPDEQHDMVVYAWQEGGVHPDTEHGPGDAWADMCFDLDPPKPGTPYFVLVPFGESCADAEDVVRASVLNEFSHWLNDRRGLDVSATFHEIVAKVKTLIDLEPVSPVAQEQSIARAIDVRYWDDYTGDALCPAPYVNTHQFEIDDQRMMSGQARLVLASRDNDLADDLLDVLVEVSTNPLDGRAHVQCAHVHLDCDDPVVSLFKIGDKLLARPNTGVSFVSDSVEINGQRESVLWIE